MSVTLKPEPHGINIAASCDWCSSFDDLDLAIGAHRRRAFGRIAYLHWQGRHGVAVALADGAQAVADFIAAAWRPEGEPS